VANLCKLAGSAGELARDGRLSLEEVVEALQEGRITEIESDAPLADDSVDAVRLSTIHRMKGLENAWVILPDLARGNPRGSRKRVDAGSVLGPAGEMLALRLDDLSNAAAAWWNRENARHEAAEEVRVFYVALTRARDRLILIAGPTRRDAPWMGALRAWGLGSDGPPEDGARLCDGRVRHRIVAPLENVRSAAGSDFTPTDEAVRRHESALEKLARAHAPLAAPSGEAEETTEASLPVRRREIGRAVGIAVHRWLEHRRDETREEGLVRLAALCVEVAEDEGVEVADLARDSREIVETFLDSGLASLLKRVEILGREVPVLLAGADGGVSSGKIDLLYRDTDGQIVVADYKTDRDTDEARLLESYGRQLDIYARAVQTALGLASAPRTEIWALRSGTILAQPARPGDAGVPGD
jgi:ATP-dependent exoDNAse (exonuclease V) beta subunit